MIESQKEEICRAHQGDERLRRDQQLLHVKLLYQNRDLREAHMKSLTEVEELKRFQGSTFDEFSRRRLIENQDTILELTARIQELTEWSDLYEWFERFWRCWISTQWTIPRYWSTSVTPTFSRSWRNAKSFSGNAEPQRKAARHLGHAWCIGKRFCKSIGVFFITLSASVESMEF